MIAYSFNKLNFTNFSMKNIDSNSSFGIIKLLDNNIGYFKNINLLKIKIISAALWLQIIKIISLS